MLRNPVGTGSRLAMRLFAFAAIIALALAMLPPGAAIAQQSTPQRGGTIIVGTESEPTTLNPYFNTGTETITPANHLFDQLVETDLEMNVKPRLAEKWDVSSDGKTYTFTIFKNAQWHDGKPVTSDDVKWSLAEVSKNFHPRLSTFFKGALEDVQTPDQYTVIVKLKEPFAPLMTILAAGGGPVILPKHVFGDGQDLKTHPANTKPIGSGPYKFKEWSKGSHLDLERHDKYHRPGVGYLDHVILQFLPDANSRWLALEKGEVDYLNYYMVPLEQVARAKASPNLAVEERGGEGTGAVEVMILNTRNETLAKREVRQALAYSIDKKALIEKAFLGLGKPAISLMHSGLKPYFNQNVPTYSYDVQKANQLLDTAGFARKADGKRFNLRLLWATGRDVETSVAEVLRDQLREVGIDVELQKVDRATAIDTVYVQWNFDAVLWVLATGPDPTQQVTRSYHTKQIQKVAFTNASGYSNADVDALFDAEFKQVDPNERVKMWQKIQELVVGDAPMLPLVEMPVENIYSRKFQNVVATPFQNSPYLGHAWTTQAGGQSTGANTTTIVAVAAAALVVLAGAGLFLLRRRRGAA